MKALIRAALSLVLCSILCSCGIEPEERSFVTAIGIDDTYEISILTAEGSVESDTNEKNKTIATGNGNNISQALEMCDIKGSGQLFFGHTVLCIINKSVLGNRNAVKDIADYMEGDTQISRRIILLAADDANKVLEITADNKDIADFVSEYYKSHPNDTAVELDKLCRALAENGNIIIPVIDSNDDSFELNGGVILANGIIKRELTKEELQSTLWLVNDNTKPEINFKVDNKSVSCTVTQKKVNITPSVITISVKLNADINDNTQHIKSLALDNIKQQAKVGLDILQSCKCDIIGMQHTFEKQGIENDFSADKFANMDIEIVVD